MRITHVVRQFHPAVGGMENVVENLASAQRANGHQVRIVTLDRVFNAAKPYRLPKHEWFNGFEIVRIPYFGSKRYPIALSVLRHIRDADIVHVHGIDFFFDYLAWTRPLHRRKLVVSTHGGFFHTSFAAGLKRFYFQCITRLSLSWYSGVITVSGPDDTTFGRIRRHGRWMIENGVDTAKFFNAASMRPVKHMVAIGRLSGNKRLDRAVQFVAALRRLDPEWKLSIVGRQWDVAAAELYALAESLGARDAVQIVTEACDDDIHTLITKCSALISSSEYEGFGLTVIEGMSAGLWPVMSDIPPFRLLADRTRLGTILDFSDPDAAARAFLAQWPHIAGHYDTVRSDAMDAAAAFEWRHVGEKYEALYRSVLGQDVRSILDVPILVRTGVANPNPTPDSNGVPGLTADDESSISILAPQTTIALGSQNGEYIGVDSQFDYRTTALADTQATLLDPFQASQASLATALNLDYTQAVPGTVTTIHVGASSTAPTGKFIFTGGVFGFLDNAGSTPYFTIGAFVQ